MIEVILSIVLYVAGVLVFYFIGKKHGEDAALEQVSGDFVDELETTCDYDTGYWAGYETGFMEAKDIADIEFAEFVATTQKAATPKKAVKKVVKKVTKKSK